ncbi:hypothetical protein [Halorussus lipolyticus]|nr:hypothetical protein [Halorussus sp. DT80]
MSEPSDRSDDGPDERQGAVEHLNDALGADQLDEAKFHVRQALQLLQVE